MSALAALRQRAWALTSPAAMASGAATLSGALYGAATLDLGPALSSFAWICAVIGVLLILSTVVLTQRWMRTLFGLASGRVPVARESLVAAAREVEKLADRNVVTGNLQWLIGVSVAALLLKAAEPQVQWTIAARLTLIAAVFGPVSTFLAYVNVTRAARRMLRAIAELGLTAEQLVEALPPKRNQLRLRMMVFTGICAFTPAILSADLAAVRAGGGLAEIASAPRSEQAAVAARNQAIALEQAVLFGALVFGITLAAAFSAGTLLSGPIREVASAARAMTSGKLGGGQPIPAEDELWAVSAAFSQMRSKLTEVLSSVRRAGLKIGSTTEQILASSDRSASGAAGQAANLNQTSATSEELARSARQIAQNASAVAELAQRTLTAAEMGQRGAHAFAASMVRSRQDHAAIAESVHRLSKRVQQIGRIVEFINGVADKSDLLALNAELEGTKAGEVGRGFQLVASEMRRLAENIIESTNEIEGLIDEIRDATGAAVAATDAGLSTTQSGAVGAEQIANHLGQIVVLAQRASSAVKAISYATQEQQESADQLSQSMSQILRVTEANVESTRQVSAVNSQLETLARELKTAVERFEA